MPLTLTTQPPPDVCLAVVRKGLEELRQLYLAQQQQRSADATSKPPAAGPFANQQSSGHASDLSQPQPPPQLLSTNPSSITVARGSSHPSRLGSLDEDSPFLLRQFHLPAASLTPEEQQQQQRLQHFFASFGSGGSSGGHAATNPTQSIGGKPGSGGLVWHPSYRQRVAGAENSALEAEIAAIQEDSLGEEQAALSSTSVSLSELKRGAARGAGQVRAL